MEPDLLRLAGLKNIGPRSAQWLAAVGIRTLGDLDQVGTVAAYRQVKAAGFPATLNLVWALEATLLGLDWRRLPADEKARLRAALARSPGKPPCEDSAP